MFHFLLIYDTEAGELMGEPRVFDHAAPAIEAYIAAEAAYQEKPSFQVVLIGSDSLDTVKVTHGNFFRRQTLQQLIDGMFPEVATLH